MSTANKSAIQLYILFAMANFRSTYYATLGFKNVSVRHLLSPAFEIDAHSFPQIDREFEILLRESDVGKLLTHLSSSRVAVHLPLSLR